MKTTDNGRASLSDIVESLLQDFQERKREQQIVEVKALASTVAT